MEFNINTDAVVKFTNKLEKLSKTAMPNSVRFALNQAAFDVKPKTMPERVNKQFEKRQPNFFKANSKVEKAFGRDLRSMKATVGFTSQSLKGSTNHAVKDLEQQEEGGAIKGRSLIPTPLARVGNNTRKAVRSAFRIGKTGKIDGNVVDATKMSGKSPQQRFAHAVAKAGAGGFVLGDRRFKGGNKILWRINSLNRTSDGKYKLTALYKVIQNRKVAITRTHFMRKSSIESAKKMEDFYIAEAKKRLDRL